MVKYAGFAPRRAMVVPGYTRAVGFYGFGGLGMELKFHDVDLDDASVAGGGTVTDSINKIAQGTTEITRLGRKCTVKNIAWRWELTLAEQDAVATPETGDTVRLIMYIDRQCNGATAAVTDILESADHLAYNNLVNKGRFKTLYDKTININFLTMASDGAGLVSQGSVTRVGAFYKSCNLPIEFDSTAGAITEIRSNNIGVLAISRAGLVAMTSKIRLRFVG